MVMSKKFIAFTFVFVGVLAGCSCVFADELEMQFASLEQDITQRDHIM